MTRLSAAILRRKLLQVLICGGGSFSRHKTAPHVTTLKPEVRSERLGELITGEESESGSDEREAEEIEEKSAAVAFEELQAVVWGLHPETSGNAGADCRREAATEIRRIAKDNAEARETLAMLGAIPPLIAMLDAELDLDSQAAALYAILNLGIGNDL